MRRWLTFCVAFMLAQMIFCSVQAAADPLMDRLVGFSVGLWGMPACGYPTASADNLRSIEAAGLSHPETCSVVIHSGVLRFGHKNDGLQFLCIVVVHEVGHLALGPRFTDNPSDPWHSRNPRSIMSEYGGYDFRPCVAWSEAVQRERHRRSHPTARAARRCRHRRYAGAGLFRCLRRHAH